MLKTILGKFNFLASLAMFFFIALMVVEDGAAARAMLLLPVIICWFAAKVLYSMDQAEAVKDMMRRRK